MTFESSRRNLLRESISVVGAMVASATIAGWAQPLPSFAEAAQESKKDNNKSEETEVTATEDLMREHSVIRRALLVYYEVIPNLRQNPGRVDASAIRQALTSSSTRVGAVGDGGEGQAGPANAARLRVMQVGLLEPSEEEGLEKRPSAAFDDLATKRGTRAVRYSFL
jgi:hypothetical protein